MYLPPAPLFLVRPVPVGGGGADTQLGRRDKRRACMKVHSGGGHRAVAAGKHGLRAATSTEMPRPSRCYGTATAGSPPGLHGPARISGSPSLQPTRAALSAAPAGTDKPEGWLPLTAPPRRTLALAVEVVIVQQLALGLHPLAVRVLAQLRLDHGLIARQRGRGGCRRGCKGRGSEMKARMGFAWHAACKGCDSTDGRSTACGVTACLPACAAKLDAHCDMGLLSWAVSCRLSWSNYRRSWRLTLLRTLFRQRRVQRLALLLREEGGRGPLGHVAGLAHSDGLKLRREGLKRACEWETGKTDCLALVPARSWDLVEERHGFTVASERLWGPVGTRSRGLRETGVPAATQAAPQHRVAGTYRRPRSSN